MLSKKSPPCEKLPPAHLPPAQRHNRKGHQQTARQGSCDQRKKVWQEPNPGNPQKYKREGGSRALDPPTRLKTHPSRPPPHCNLILINEAWGGCQTGSVFVPVDTSRCAHLFWFSGGSCVQSSSRDGGRAHFWSVRVGQLSRCPLVPFGVPPTRRRHASPEFFPKAVKFGGGKPRCRCKGEGGSWIYRVQAWRCHTLRQICRYTTSNGL